MIRFCGTPCRAQALRPYNRRFCLPLHLVLGVLLTGGVSFMTPVLAQEVVSRPFRVTVNSPLDGPIAPDQALTLREAIALANGSLSWDALSQAEQHLVVPAPSNTVVFNLPPTATTIQLQSELPAIAQAETTLDGTTQPGFQPGLPVVTLTPAPGVAIARGLTILGDRVTVRGLNLYGFATRQDHPEPSGDVLIMALRSSPQSAKEVGMVNVDHAPEGVAIEDNRLGYSPDGLRPTAPSDFGVVVLQAQAPMIRRNAIAHHSGSGILAHDQAEGMEIADNRIEQNGFGAMADGIRLTGRIAGTTLRNNTLRGNGGSAIYLFKPEGAVTIQGNTLQGNGTRLHQAAVYLMGSGHQVLDNLIQDQNGPGVVVAAYPQSDRIAIQNNRFAQIKGLSIDLVARQHTAVTNYLAGDGPNPTRDTGNRRRDTGNGSVNTPEFLSPTFVRQGRQVNIDGKADPGTTVTLYRVTEAGDRGPLSEPFLTVQTDEQGRFGATLDTLKANDAISAIATDPQYGTSEPALNATIQGGDPDLVEIPMPQPRISFNPNSADPVKPIPLRVPHIVHFALDQDTLS
ncbi:MAG: right-handed parallel beta-helix repeat-containing protein, partial [Thermosynechococcaceae cyanobacterium]